MARRKRVPTKVYEFIKVWKQEHDGNSPAYSDIAKHFGWKSETTAWWAVDQFAKDNPGRIRFSENRHIELIDGEYIPPE